MIRKKSKFWKIVLLIEVPIILVLYAVSAGWLYLLKSFIQETEKYAMIQHTTLLIMGAGLAVLTVVVIVFVKIIVTKTSSISEQIDRLMANNPPMTADIRSDSEQEQWDAIETIWRQSQNVSKAAFAG